MADKSRGKTIVSGIIFALVCLGFGTWMLIAPDMVFDDEGPTSRRSGTLFTILRWVWGWPGGIVLILLGLLTVAGMLMKQSDSPTQQ